MLKSIGKHSEGQAQRYLNTYTSFIVQKVILVGSDVACPDK